MLKGEVTWHKCDDSIKIELRCDSLDWIQLAQDTKVLDSYQCGNKSSC